MARRKREKLFNKFKQIDGGKIQQRQRGIIKQQVLLIETEDTKL